MPTFETFYLPDAGEGLTEADIVTWLVAVGDTVEVNQPLLEVETAKSLVELPCPVDGVVTELLVREGDTVEVGAPIVVFDVDPLGAAAGISAPGLRAAPGGADAAGTDTPDPAGFPGSTATGSVAPARFGSGLADDSSGLGLQDALPPAAYSPSGPAAYSPSGPGEPHEDAAHREHVAHHEHAEPVGTYAPTAVPVHHEEPAPASPAVLVGYGVTSFEAARRPRRVEVLSPFGEQTDAEIDHPVFAKPPVRRLAKELGIDLSTVSPSGPGGVVTREDILQQAKAREPRTLATYIGDDQPWLESGIVSADGRMTRVPVKSVRKRTAEAMVRSAFSAPHVTVFHTLDVTATMDLVAKLKTDKEFADVRVTPLLIAAKALLFAIRRHPEVNASWDEDRQEIVYKHYVNLGIAAATPRGLIVPNIKDAHRYDLHTLAQELQDLTAEARNGTTSPGAMQDGTITITNVGVFGIDTGTPILNPGEAAILAFGAVRQQPWVHEGEIKIRWVTQLALSFDHRLVDGELGSRVLSDVATVLGDPTKALVWS
jgi:2-oxoisovalerate dehydrogenase E2 component (dihydrolipoyl transacylase)